MTPSSSSCSILATTINVDRSVSVTKQNFVALAYTATDSSGCDIAILNLAMIRQIQKIKYFVLDFTAQHSLLLVGILIYIYNC